MTKKTIILTGFIVLKLLVPFLVISDAYDLQRDEYLHLDMAHHLAWGYASVPPVTSWISWLIYILGNTIFWVKFFPSLFGALTILVVWKTITELNGNLYALVLGATCVLFSALLRVNILFQPNSLDILCWTAFYFMLVKYINTQKSTWLYIAALVFAIGFLNKYNIAFLLIGLFPAILMTEHRRILTEKHFYGAVIFGLILIAPNLIWQIRNEFPVFRHLKELAATQLVFVKRSDFLKEQLLYFNGALVVIIAGLFALLRYPPFRKYILYFPALVFTLIVFTYLKAKSYYAIGLYPVYIAFGAVYLESILHSGWKKYLRPVILFMPLLLFIPFYGIIFPNKSPQYISENPKPYQKYGLLRWEDGKEHILPQDFADMLGWKELAEKVDSISKTIPDPTHTILLCDNYGQAGAINYYSKNKSIRAVSFNADYINWIDTSQHIVNAILVKEGDDEDKERKTEKPLFDTVYLAGKRINSFASEPEISIYVLRGARVDINKRIRDEIHEKKYGKLGE